MIETSTVISLAETDAARRARLGLCEEAELAHNLAAELKQLGQFTAAAIAMRRAISLNPHCGLLWNGLGAIIWNMGDYDGAREAYEKAKKLGGADNALLHSNCGLLLASTKQFAEAEENFRIARELEPGNQHVAWNMSHLHLESGNWEAGLKEYEIRIAYRGKRLYPDMPYPMWKGEDLSGKTIYVQAEQGAGDRILLSRYLHWMHVTWPTATIKFCPDDTLVPLFWKFFEFIEFSPNNIPWPKADYGIFLGSLPMIHGTTPDNVYPDPGLIREGAASIRAMIPPPRNPALRVGICWTGNPAMDRNIERSIPLHMMMELMDNPNVQLYSLQFGSGSEELRQCGGDKLIYDLVPTITDKGYIGTAAAMLHLDLILTVCTSAAHLAGALGVPCWTMLCHDPYWVWLRDSDKTAWYPNTRLFRQERPMEWEPVLREVKTALAEYAEKHVTQLAA